MDGVRYEEEDEGAEGAEGGGGRARGKENSQATHLEFVVGVRGLRRVNAEDLDQAASRREAHLLREQGASLRGAHGGVSGRMESIDLSDMCEIRQVQPRFLSEVRACLPTLSLCSVNFLSASCVAIPSIFTGRSSSSSCGQ